MKIKDIIKIQGAIHEAIDFVACNGDGDETNVTEETVTELNESLAILEKEKDRIYLNNALKKIRKKKK